MIRSRSGRGVERNVHFRAAAGSTVCESDQSGWQALVRFPFSTAGVAKKQGKTLFVS
jgi:hypothetical protein